MSKKAIQMNSVQEIFVFVISLTFMFLFRFIPPFGTVTPYGMALLGIFIGVIFGWCFGGNNTLWTSLLGLFALGITMQGGVLVACMQVFSSYVFIIVMLSLFTIGALMDANIGEYLVVKILSVKFIQGHPWRLVLLLFLGTYFLSFATNPMVIGIFLLNVYATMFKQAGYKPGDKTPTMIILATVIIALLETINRPWQTPQIIAIQALQGATGIETPYGPYMFAVIIFSIIFIVAMVLLMRIMKCDVEKLTNIDLSDLQEQYKDGLSTHQKGVLIATLVLAIGSIVLVFFPTNLGIISTFVTSQVTIIGWMVLIVAIMLFVKIDGKLLLSPQVLATNFPWPLLMMIGVGVTLGSAVVGEGTGVSEWIGGLLGPALVSMGETTFYIILAAAGVILTNLLNNNAMAIMLSSIVAGLYLQGVVADPILAILIVIVSTTFGFVTPASSFYGALIHGNEFVEAKSIYKYGIIMACFSWLLTIVLFVPISNICFSILTINL